MTRGRDGRPRPHRSGEPEQFHRCGDIAALQALARATRAAGQECWCSVLPRTEPVAGGKAVPGGTVLWADVDTPGTLWRARALRERLPVRLVVESGGASDPREPRWHLYLAASRWLAADELETANARLAQLLGGDRVGDRGRLMRLPGTRNLKAGRPGRWCRVVACDLHAPALDVESVRRRAARSGAASAGAVRRKARDAAARDSTSSPHASGSRSWSPIADQRLRLRACPLHDDHVPSLKLYEEPRDGWYCWACARGGDLIEYAAWRWHRRASRGLDASEFRGLVARLQVELGLTRGRHLIARG